MTTSRRVDRIMPSMGPLTIFLNSMLRTGDSTAEKRVAMGLRKGMQEQPSCVVSGDVGDAQAARGGPEASAGWCHEQFVVECWMTDGCRQQRCQQAAAPRPTCAFLLLF